MIRPIWHFVKQTFLKLLIRMRDSRTSDLLMSTLANVSILRFYKPSVRKLTYSHLPMSIACYCFKRLVNWLFVVTGTCHRVCSRVTHSVEMAPKPWTLFSEELKQSQPQQWCVLGSRQKDPIKDTIQLLCSWCGGNWGRAGPGGMLVVMMGRLRSHL